MPELDAAYNTVCTSTANNCGAVNTWVISCTGECSVSAPADEVIWGTCTTETNNCWEINTWTIQCGGTCSVTSAPIDNTQLGTSCTTEANNCGTTNTWSYTCEWICDVSAPADLQYCSCANPTSNYGVACTSEANICGDTWSGTIQCDGSCSATKPIISDADDDWIADCTDSCLWFDNDLIWTSCDDGSLQTKDDRYTNSCICEGTKIIPPQIVPKPENDTEEDHNSWGQDLWRNWTWGGNYCGDGELIEASWEECDDWNNIDGDWCSSNCEIEWWNRSALQAALINRQANETTWESIRDVDSQKTETIVNKSTNLTVVESLRDIRRYVTKLESLKEKYWDLGFYTDGTMKYMNYISLLMNGMTPMEQVDYGYQVIQKLEESDDYRFDDMDISRRVIMILLEGITKKVEQGT